MKKILLTVLALLWIASATAATKDLNIVVTINPIYSLVSNVLGGSQNMHLLIGKNQSPHDYQIRPSDVRKLNKADLIFTIGDGFEVFLFNYITKSNLDNKVIRLVNAKGLKLLPLKEPVYLNACDLSNTHPHCHDERRHKSYSMNIDWHFWGDIENAKAIVREIEKQLSAINPSHAAVYAANARNTIVRLDELHLKMKHLLFGLDKYNFVAMHDGYQYIEQIYKLSNVGTVVMDKNFTHSARKLKRLKQIVHDKKVQCMFTEPQVSSYLMDRVSSFLDTKVGQLDIEWGAFGTEVTPQDLYFFMMERNSENIKSCLQY